MFGLTRGRNKRTAGTEEVRRELEAQFQQVMITRAADDQAVIRQTIGQATRVIMAKLQQMEKRMDARLDALLGAVESQQTKIDSLVALTNGLHDQVLAAIGEGALTPSQKMRVDAVFKAVEDNSADIDAALTANTVDATKGAISDGPSMGDIKGGLTGGPVNAVDPGPAIGSTGTGNPAT